MRKVGSRRRKDSGSNVRRWCIPSCGVKKCSEFACHASYCCVAAVRFCKRSLGGRQTNERWIWCTCSYVRQLLDFGPLDWTWRQRCVSYVLEFYVLSNIPMLTGSSKWWIPFTYQVLSVLVVLFWSVIVLVSCLQVSRWSFLKELTNRKKMERAEPRTFRFKCLLAKHVMILNHAKKMKLANYISNFPHPRQCWTQVSPSFGTHWLDQND